MHLIRCIQVQNWMGVQADWFAAILSDAVDEFSLIFTWHLKINKFDAARDTICF